MIYGIKQFKLGQGQLLLANSSKSVTKYLNTKWSQAETGYINDKVSFSIFEEIGRQPNCVIDVSRSKDLKYFETYLQYVCGLHGVKEIYWRLCPCECGNWCLAMGAFVIEGDFQGYEEI